MADESPTPASRPVGAALFALIFLALSLFLLSQLGEQAKFSAKGKLFSQPAFWPGVGVIGMSLFGLIHLLKSMRGVAPGAELAEGAQWLRALEYFAWFMAYVLIAPVIGYLFATLIFTVSLAFRAGYRSARHLLIAAAAGLAIVLIFKTGLSVAIPGGAIYEYLPGGLRSFMIVNF